MGINAVIQATGKPPTLAERVYRELRSDILTCRLRPATRLQINTLAEDRDVSLSGVREALWRLSSEGLVVSEPQRGFHVAAVSMKELSDLTTARIEIEKLCLARSVENGGVDWETEIIASMHRLSRTPYWTNEDARQLNEGWVVAHDQFHNALVSATENASLSRIRDTLYLQGERYRRLSVLLHSSKRKGKKEHQALADALLERDSPLACQLIGAHLTLSMNIISQSLRRLPQ